MKTSLLGVRPLKKVSLGLVALVLQVLTLTFGCHHGPTAAELRQMELDFQSLSAQFPDANLNLGREVYLRHCSVCHQADGKGVVGAIPPLAGHAPKLVLSDGGRYYVARLLLYGINGRIQVDQRTFLNMMPALGGMLGDADLAAAFNYVLLSWGNQAQINQKLLLRAEDFSTARSVRLTPAQVLELRPAGIGAQP